MNKNRNQFYLVASFVLWAIKYTMPTPAPIAPPAISAPISPPTAPPIAPPIVPYAIPFTKSLFLSGVDEL